jgi:hypothetical protein
VRYLFSVRVTHKEKVDLHKELEEDCKEEHFSILEVVF